ncbi:PTS fructose-like transporter subunit IIB [Lactiplantibacillus sp. DA1]|uniref:PTS fructose-like transporter subunit IIB n=1 Tax=Lactiplantibacillus sp. DA1 TaxID=3079857 RepID=UPI00292A5F8B|nr:PTS fructose-like transporter subunit IIB [Lactiplantibacillus sp. DA1]MDV0431712.1 PTS fructose-like transporter subunit IIB [Lactiplantibacillus sp. DA1]
MKIVGVTACPSGVAHTYMAAESLQLAAKKHKDSCFVETQGQIGIENELTTEQIKDADVVILTNDIGIKDEKRFIGKPVLKVGTSDLVNKSEIIINKLTEKFDGSDN